MTAGMIFGVLAWERKWVKRPHDHHSIDVTREILTNSKMRVSPCRQGFCVEIERAGVWKRVCRTDLRDDVQTYTTVDENYDPEECRQLMLGKIKYGAREDWRSFGVIDQATDG